MKKRIIRYLSSFYNSKKEEWDPQLIDKVEAMAFESYDPIDSKDKVHYNLSCTKWSNGEGYLFFFTIYNTQTKKEKIKTLDLNLSEIELILFSLDNFKYFDNE